MFSRHTGRNAVSVFAIYCVVFASLAAVSGQRREAPTSRSGVKVPSLNELAGDSQVSRFVAARRAAREYQRNEKQGSKGASDYLTSLIAADPDLQKGFGVLTCDTGQNIDVEASAGTAQAGYATLGAAFAAINAGTHQGDIAVEICGSTNEGTDPANLNSSDATPASYNAIEVYPLADGLSITGNPANGFGVLQFNGSDNIVLDGDNPITPDINQNLTITNANAATGNYNSVIRIATSSTVQSADNVIIRNLIINGNATGRNQTGINGANIAANTTFCIYVGGNGGTTPTNAPTAISSITTQGIASGATVNDFLAENNTVNRCARGIQFLGGSSNMSNSVLVRNNSVGSQMAGDTTGVYSIGIAVQGSSLIQIVGNVVYVESFLSLAIRGIEIGPATAAGAFGTVIVEKNRVERVRSNRELAQGAYGINISGGNNHTIRNNFVSGVSNRQSDAGTALNLTSAAVGIRIGLGSGHQILHNSVHLFGIQVGSEEENLTAAFALVPTTVTNLNVRNNIFSNQMSGGNPTGTRHVAIFVPDAGSSIGLALNNNAYYQGTATNSRMARRGTDMFDPAVEYQAANFNPSATTPSTNFRAHSTLLGAFGNSNDNASFATTTAPPFVSDSDLHIPTAVGGPLDGGGADVGVVDDIDGDLRGPLPEIGADELVGPTSANLPISGRVVTAGGRGLANASVRLEGGPLSDPRTAITNAFGFFVIEGVPAGYTYLISVNSRRFVFAEPVRVITLDDKIGEIVFTALP